MISLFFKALTVLHTLFRQQIIPASLEQVWDFFSDPHNLNTLTPPEMNFHILTDPLARMFPGQLIEYRVEFIRGLPWLWVTEIAHMRENEYFVDEQRLGPYQFWYHEHSFRVASGGVQMTDRVNYSIGYGPLGDLINRVWVARRLQNIFDYRVAKIAQLFPGGD